MRHTIKILSEIHYRRWSYYFSNGLFVCFQKNLGVYIFLNSLVSTNCPFIFLTLIFLVFFFNWTDEAFEEDPIKARVHRLDIDGEIDNDSNDSHVGIITHTHRKLRRFFQQKTWERFYKGSQNANYKELLCCFHTIFFFNFISSSYSY